MAQIINTNIMSLNAQRNLSATQSALATSVQRLSTGLRVNSAKDDAAGLAIAERMSTQVRGMNVAIRNANDAISLSQTAEGALSKINDMGQRMRELAVQSANATNNDSDRASLNQEYQALAEEIKRTLSSTAFNGTKMFAAGAALTFQIGAGTILGGSATAALVVLVALRRGVGGDNLILAGIALSEMLSATNNYLISRASLQSAEAAKAWQYGSFNAISWGQVRPLLIAAIVLLPQVLWLLRPAPPACGWARGGSPSVLLTGAVLRKGVLVRP